MLVCPNCRCLPNRRADSLYCKGCETGYPIVGGIVDFLRIGIEAPDLTATDVAGLHYERGGVSARIRDYYLPLLLKKGAKIGDRVLDCGCGNGESVEELRARGFDAWGLDNSSLRASQWAASPARDQLVLADGLLMPFESASFDFVLCSGVLEHIGVSEYRLGDRYVVQALPQRDDERLRFWNELARVVRPGGTIWIDFPNGGFPVDFWHGDQPGQARWHRLDEGFLPRPREVRSLFAKGMRARALSPAGRFGFNQVGAHWYGKMLRLPAQALLKAMTWPGLGLLAESPINPFLVYEVTLPDARAGNIDRGPGGVIDGRG